MPGVSLQWGRRGTPPGGSVADCLAGVRQRLVAAVQPGELLLDAVLQVVVLEEYLVAVDGDGEAAWYLDGLPAENVGSFPQRGVFAAPVSMAVDMMAENQRIQAMATVFVSVEAL